jgi:hypothetical protein
MQIGGLFDANTHQPFPMANDLTKAGRGFADKRNQG